VQWPFAHVRRVLNHRLEFEEYFSGICNMEVKEDPEQLDDDSESPLGFIDRRVAPLTQEKYHSSSNLAASPKASSPPGTTAAREGRVEDEDGFSSGGRLPVRR